ncbi:MAG: glycine cleavage system protein GcvH [Rhodospirillales bacterium]|nr:glycine cleavage system protein GcvH [Rhodospirillales bacterium]
MSEIRFTSEHEWVRVENGVGTVGVSDYAQSQLGDVVFVELPAVGSSLNKGAEAAVVESVKAASEIYAPLSGEVVAINDDLVAQPGTVNEDPMEKGWFFKLRLTDPGELATLMDQAGYDEYVKGLA